MCCGAANRPGGKIGHQNSSPPELILQSYNIQHKRQGTQKLCYYHTATSYCDTPETPLQLILRP
jgi:hypothetical protein